MYNIILELGQLLLSGDFSLKLSSITRSDLFKEQNSLNRRTGFGSLYFLSPSVRVQSVFSQYAVWDTSFNMKTVSFSWLRSAVRLGTCRRHSYRSECLHMWFGFSLDLNQFYLRPGPSGLGLTELCCWKTTWFRTSSHWKLYLIFLNFKWNSLHS